MSMAVVSPLLPTPSRRVWLPLVPVLLGLALYSTTFILRFAPEILPPGTMMAVIMCTMWGPLASVVFLVIGWLVLGQPRLRTRLLSAGLLGVVCAGVVTAAHADTRFFFVIWGIPAAVGILTVTLALLSWAPPMGRWGTAIVLGLAATLPWQMIRMEGVTGDFGMNPAWRWTPTAEENVARFNEEQEESTPFPLAVPLQLTDRDWPGFRGPGRDGRAPALPASLVEAWRRPVGPAWSSVSGVGERIFTQEQRGEEELVVCYDLNTGRQLWLHKEETRHFDGPSGAGPRATPTYHEGKLYTLGGKGALLCLDAATGVKEWGIELTKTLEVASPNFGFACSPLVSKGKVYVQPGVKGPLLAAFDARTGKKLWAVGEQVNESYSSPQRAVLAGVEQILVFSAEGLTGHDTETGAELWHYEWKSEPTAQPSVQPTLLPGNRVVVGGAQPGSGFRCLEIKKGSSGWSLDVAWETTRVCPRFNDVVLYQGNLYGLDSGRVFCMNAADGEVRWKTRDAKYGTGQLVLAGGRLVVVGERGQVSLFAPDPATAPTPTRIEALNDKTWNHPAVIQGRLIVRNAKEMICFEAKK